MKTIKHILILLVVAGLIGGTTGLIIKAVDSSAAAAPANGSNNLNKKQSSPGGSNPTQKSPSPITVKQTFENLGKITLIVTGVWLIERLMKNRRRKVFVAVRAPQESEYALEPAWRGPKQYLPLVRFQQPGRKNNS
jgi:hypothetical protein